MWQRKSELNILFLRKIPSQNAMEVEPKVQFLFIFCDMKYGDISLKMYYLH